MVGSISPPLLRTLVRGLVAALSLRYQGGMSWPLRTIGMTGWAIPEKLSSFRLHRSYPGCLHLVLAR